MVRGAAPATRMSRLRNLGLRGRRVETELSERLTELPQRFSGFSRAGLALAALWLVAASTPSLLPRPWWLQGVVAAVSAVCGYVVGLLIGALVKAFASWIGLEVSVDERRWHLLVRGLLVLLFLFACAFPFLTIGWQQYVTSYVGLTPPGLWYPVGSTIVAIIVFVVVLWIWRAVASLLDFFPYAG